MDPGRDDPPDQRRAYSVEVAGLGGPRNRPGRTAVVASVVVLALVAGGILSGQLFPVERTAVAPSVPASGSAVVLASATPMPSTTPEGAPVPIPSGLVTARITADPVRVAALVAAIPRHGTGPLAFLSGRLRSTQRPCEPNAPLSACLVLRVDGLRGAPVVPDDTMRVWPGDPVLGETLVLLPRDGKLVYLGSLLVDAAGIPGIDTLTATVRSVPVGPSQLLPSLHEADGILLRSISPCIWQDLCPLGAPTLAVIPPPGGSGPISEGAEPVEVVDGAFGIRPTATWTTGPFLLRIRTDVGTDVAWDVVAREDQGSILHVAIPFPAK